MEIFCIFVSLQKQKLFAFLLIILVQYNLISCLQKINVAK